jgi:hypothetical protein
MKGIRAKTKQQQKMSLFLVGTQGERCMSK